MAGLLYLGSGIGRTLYRRLNNAPAVKLPRHEQPRFAGAIVAGAEQQNPLHTYEAMEHGHEHRHDAPTTGTRIMNGRRLASSIVTHTATNR